MYICSHRASFFKGKTIIHLTPNKDFSHAQVFAVVRNTAVMFVFSHRCRLIKRTFSFDQQEKRERTKKPRLIEPQNGGSSSDPLRPIRLPQPSVVESILIQRGAPRYCGSAHTSWEQTELPQDTVKKKHQYFIKLLSLSGPDQSLDSHSPIGREDSFVFAPQVEQQSDSLRFWKPCNAQPIHLMPRCLAFGGGSKRKSWDCEGENMFQRCPEIELLGLVVLCYVSPCFSPGRPVVSLIVKTNRGCCDLSLKDSDSISLY